MKASELRIGNWIKIINQINYDAGEGESDYFDDRDFQVGQWDQINKYDNVDYTPIELSSEWFRRLCPDEKIEIATDLFVGFDFDIGRPCICYVSEFCFTSILLDQIKFVHTFQNLVFSLTGKDLPLNQNP